MGRKMERIAVYSRKSKFTGKGESIGNQIEMCKEYIRVHHGEDAIVSIYEDEGFSGGSLERPKFQQMMSDIREGKIDILMCYRLDRLSRNTGDFFVFIAELNSYNVQFVSVNEQFDTKTPIGRAMMSIASVFAQMEREIIAERVRDNMLELAKTGRWLGGVAPTGYRSEKVQKFDIDGKERQAFMLVPIEVEKALVKMIYSRYLKERSLTALETYLLQSNIKTKNGRAFTRFSLKAILENPVYAMADEDMFRFFRDQEIDIFADECEFNGACGVMAYNKTEQVKHRTNKKRDIAEWIVSVGKHEGFINGASWICVQGILTKNHSARYRRPRVNNALLTGLVVCGECGSLMRPKIHRAGVKNFSYLCELKEKSKGKRCNCKNVNGLELDFKTLETIKHVAAPKREICVWLRRMMGDLDTKKSNEEEHVLRNQHRKNKYEIVKLIENIKYLNSDAIAEVSDEIARLRRVNQGIENEIAYLNKKKDNIKTNKDINKSAMQVLEVYVEQFDTLELMQKRSMLKSLIKNVVITGENVKLNFLGEG